MTQYTDVTEHDNLAARQPVGIGGAISALPPLIIAVLVVFGIDLDQAQQIAVLALVAGIIALVTAVQRTRVRPVKPVDPGVARPR